MSPAMSEPTIATLGAIWSYGCLFLLYWLVTGDSVWRTAIAWHRENEHKCPAFYTSASVVLVVDPRP